MIASYMRGRTKCSAPAARKTPPRRARDIPTSLKGTVPFRWAPPTSGCRWDARNLQGTGALMLSFSDGAGEEARAGALGAGVAGPAGDEVGAAGDVAEGRRVAA